MENPSAQRPAQLDAPKEISLVETILFLWKRKWWIGGGTLLITLLGGIYARQLPPVYYSEALITPKSQTTRAGSALLSQLGSLAGAAAAELPIGDNNLQILLATVRSRDLAANVIKRKSLVEKLYPESWNAKTGNWVVPDSGQIPTMRMAVERLRQEYLVASIDPIKNILTLGINAYDPALACEIVDAYLVCLNQQLLLGVKEEAETNRAYLQRQLSVTSDPWLVEKMQALIAAEIEKVMLVNSRSFRILEKPVIPLTHSKPKRKQIIAIAFVAGAVFSLCMSAFVSVVSDTRKRIAQGR